MRPHLSFGVGDGCHGMPLCLRIGILGEVLIKIFHVLMSGSWHCCHRGASSMCFESLRSVDFFAWVVEINKKLHKKWTVCRGTKLKRTKKAVVSLWSPLMFSTATVIGSLRDCMFLGWSVVSITSRHPVNVRRREEHHLEISWRSFSSWLSACVCRWIGITYAACFHGDGQSWAAKCSSFWNRDQNLVPLFD